MDVTALNVRLNQLERNVDALVNQSASVTARIVGARQIMTSIANTSIAWGTTNFTGVASGGTPVSGLGGEVTVMTTTFQLGLQATVLLDSGLMGWVTYTGPGPVVDIAPVYMRITGQVNSSIGAINLSVSTDTQGIAANSSAPYQRILLPAASYTVKYLWNSTNGASDVLTVKSAVMDVFLLGS